MRAYEALLFAALTLSIAAVPGAPPAAAQVPFGVEDCDFEEVLETDAARSQPDEYGQKWGVRHPRSVFARLRPLMDAGEWGRVGTALADDFRVSGVVPQGGLRDAFQTQLDSLAGDFRGVEGDIATIAQGGGVNQTRFQYFRSNATLFATTTAPIALYEVQPDSVRRDLCWRALAAHRVLTYYGRDGRENALQALQHTLRLWDRYLAASYSQYPWELLANSFLQRATSGDREGASAVRLLAPPRTQLVLLHPGVAVEAAGLADGLDGVRRLDVLTLEPIGVLFYGASRGGYVGISTLVTVPREGGAGVGGLLHFGRRAQLGYVYRDAGGSGAGNALVFSVDLLGWITGAPQALRDARARAEGALLAGRQADGGAPATARDRSDNPND